MQRAGGFHVYATNRAHGPGEGHQEQVAMMREALKLAAGAAILGVAGCAAYPPYGGAYGYSGDYGAPTADYYGGGYYGGGYGGGGYYGGGYAAPGYAYVPPAYAPSYAGVGVGIVGGGWGGWRGNDWRGNDWRGNDWRGNDRQGGGWNGGQTAWRGPRPTPPPRVEAAPRFVPAPAPRPPRPFLGGVNRSPPDHEGAR
jgi:hypothetical protein